MSERWEFPIILALGISILALWFGITADLDAMRAGSTAEANYHRMTDNLLPRIVELEKKCDAR